MNKGNICIDVPGIETRKYHPPNYYIFGDEDIDALLAQVLIDVTVARAEQARLLLLQR